MLNLLVALSLQGTGAQAAPVARYDPERASVGALRDSLEAAELRFFSQWTDAFKLTQGYRPPIDDIRWAVANCNVWSDRAAKRVDSARWTGRVKSSASVFSVCPTWPLGDSLPYDERMGRDLALAERFRAPVRTARESIISVFATAMQAVPGDDWIRGQLVRLLVDQRELDRALGVARNCDAGRTWCAMLIGYVLAEQGRVRAADSVFVATLGGMDRRSKCEWIDITPLLEPALDAKYAGSSCESREELDDRVWWLADPLWSEPGNARRAEHYARRVANALRTALNRDERWDWRDAQGGDALRALVVRYGWPSYLHWWGLLYDRAQTGRYLVASRRGAVNPPYTTFEYATGRIETIPSARAIENPFTSTSADWRIVSPSIAPLKPPIDTTVGGPTRLTRWLEEEAMSQIAGWGWPRSHFALATPIAQLPDAEVVFLRRQSNAIISAVMVLDDSTRRTAIDATVLTTARPDSFRRIAQFRATPGVPLVFFGSLETQPSLIGIELADSSRPGPVWHARTRYAIVPPKPLSTMARGETALSDVVLLDASGGDDLPVATDELLRRARPSTLSAGALKFGVFWETYGIAATDTVEIAVWLERYTAQGILRQFGIALNVARDLNTPVSVSWIENGLSPRANVLPGAVPIVGRSVVIDIGDLAPGQYWIDVAVRRPGQQAVRSRRTLTVQRP